MLSIGGGKYSGEFAFTMGFPCKSGVGGSLMIVIPGVCGFATWSPRLDSIGNSGHLMRLCHYIPTHPSIYIYTYTHKHIHTHTHIYIYAKLTDWHSNGDGTHTRTHKMLSARSGLLQEACGAVPVSYFRSAQQCSLQAHNQVYIYIYIYIYNIHTHTHTHTCLHT